MHVSFRNTVALAAVAAAAGLSWYYSRRPPEPGEPATAAAGPPLSYYLRDATLLGTNESGKYLFRIRAARAVQETDEAGLELTGVEVEYRDAEAVGWSIRAERASTPADHSFIELEHVRLANDAAAEPERMIIETPHLRLDPDEYLASTSAAVRIRVGNATLSGKGLQARLREDYIKLESEVRGHVSR